jgi:hypothetical protein
MALTIVSNANQLFTGVSTAGGFSFADLRNLGFFESTEPVSLGSCFLDYNVGVGSDPFDPVIGVSTYNVGVPSTGSISPTDLVGVVRELRLDISGSGSKVDLKNLAFGSEQSNNIRKNVFISTDCVISSDDPNTAALSLTGGYNNLRLTISGQLLGAGGIGAAQNSGANGGKGGDALNIVNNLGIGARIQITETGQLKAGGGGGGAGQNGVQGSSAQYVCGSGCNGCQRSCRPGCCYDCGGGFNCCFDPCCSTYTNFCTSAGGAAGQGGVGGLGRGGNYPSGTLDGGSGTAGGSGSNGSGSGTAGGNGGAGGDYGKPGNPGSAAPSTGGGGPGQGGSPGYAITGAYGLAGFIAGIVTGILPEPTYGFTTSANATVGFAGSQQVWEFVSTGSTEMSIAKTQNVDLLVVGGGSNVVSGGRGGGGGAVQYRQLLTLQGGRYNISVGSAGQASSISHVDGTTFSLTANGANSSSSQGGQTIVYDGAGNEVTNTVYPSRGSGGNSIVTHGPEAYGGGGGATQGGSNGSTQSGGPCWKAYNGTGNECLGPYSANGGKGGNGLQVNVRISGTNEYFGSGGGGAAGESSNCNGPDCGVSVSQGAMGPGQYGRGRRPSGQNHGSPINATQGILVIKYLDFVP